MRAWRALGVVAWAAALAVGAAASASAADTFTKTKYPIFIIHGLGGTPIDASVIAALTAGGAIVYEEPSTLAGIPGVPANDWAVLPSEVRAPILRGLIQQALATCAPAVGRACDKVNVIAFSKGGFDARVLLADPLARPLLASVTTVASPHKGGGDLANKLLGCLFPPLGAPCDPAAAAAFLGLQTFLQNNNLVSGPQAPPGSDPIGEALLLASLAQISTLDTTVLAGALAPLPVPVLNNPTFNTKYPIGLPGSSCGNGAALTDGTPSSFKILLFGLMGNKVKTGSTAGSLDRQLEDALVATSQFLQDDDGIVERCKAHFGVTTIDTLPLNHFDEGGQIGGNAIASATLRAHAALLKSLKR